MEARDAGAQRQPATATRRSQALPRSVRPALRAIDAPKTLIFISEGFVAATTAALIIELGALAAAARTSLYALKLDTQLFDITSARAPVNRVRRSRRRRPRARDAGRRGARRAVQRHRHRRSRCSTRIESELSGYYLLGVESDPARPDGKPHPIRIDVPRTRRDRPVAAAARERGRAIGRRRASPRDAVAAGADVAAAGVGAAAARRDVRAAGPGAATRCSC